jgi:hypothetical protein
MDVCGGWLTVGIPHDLFNHSSPQIASRQDFDLLPLLSAEKGFC